MAKKIFKGIGSLLGIGKKKKAEPAPVEEKKGPIITQLNEGPGSALDPRQRRKRPGAFGTRGAATILADKLGSY